VALEPFLGHPRCVELYLKPGRCHHQLFHQHRDKLPATSASSVAGTGTDQRVIPLVKVQLVAELDELRVERQSSTQQLLPGPIVATMDATLILPSCCDWVLRDWRWTRNDGSKSSFKCWPDSGRKEEWH
jgi:hypothetical protein